MDCHLKTEKHKKNIADSNNNCKIEKFLVQKNTVLADKICAAELTLAYHIVQHHLSFNSSNCTTKLMSQIFNDSTIATNISSAKTKTEALIKSVICPYIQDNVKKAVDDVKFVGICTDGSNHKDIKIFPVVLQYFDRKNGIQQKIVDLQSVPNERAVTIHSLLMKCLTDTGCLSKCVAFGGDNCNTNFGSRRHTGTNNVFSLLQDSIKFIKGSGCPAHVLNNTIQHAVDRLPVDIELILTKLYGYFSIYTLRVEELKSFCDFVETDYRTILSHSKTRWLSLYPVLHRTLEMYEPLRSYFLSIPNPPKVLKSFFDNPINECYMLFVHSLSYMFHQNVLLMEKSNNCIVETMNILDDVLQILNTKKSTKFIPMTVKATLRKLDLSPQEEASFTDTCVEMYEIAKDYLSAWTEQYNEFKVFTWMTLKEKPEWKDVEETITFLIANGIEIDDGLCNSQFGNFIKFYEQTGQHMECSVSEKWVKYFQTEIPEKYSEFLTICQYMFSLVGHNANVERIFNLIESQWSDERNRLSVETIRSLISVKYNYINVSCIDFYKQICSDKALLKQVKSSQKYDFVQKE